MMTPLGFHMVRGRVFELLAWVMLTVALLAAPSALAGDQGRAPDTFIDSGPDWETTSTTADFVLRATVARRPEFWCLLDDATEYRPCTATPRYEGLTPGEHYFAAYAYDPDTGLWDPWPADYLWIVVEGPPPLDGGTPDGGALDAGSPGGEDAGGPDAGSSGGEDAGSSGGEDGGGGPGPDAGSSGGTDAGTSGGEDAGSSGGADAGGPGPDAGSSGGEDAGGGPGPDAGSSGGEDAGSSGGTDAGTPNQDAGSSGGDDAGSSGDTDGGSPDGGPSDGGSGNGGVPPGDGVPPDALDYLGGGVGCTGAPAPSAIAGLLLLGLALRRRRR